MKKYLIGLAIFLVLAFLFVTAQTRPAGEFAMPLSVFEAELAADNVERVDVEGDQLVGKLRTQRTIENQPVMTFRTALPPGTTAGWNFMEWLLENRRNATVNVNNDNNLLVNILVPLIPWLLIFFFIWFFVFRQLRKVQTNAAQPMRVIVVNPTGAEQQQPPPAPPLV